MGVALRLGQVGLGFALVTAVITGCGDSESNNKSAGGASQTGGAGSPASVGVATGGSGAGTNSVAGGGSSNGGGGNGSKEGSGVLELGDSFTEGCIAYAYAVCQRGYTCRNSVPGSSTCLRVTFGCPDLTGSEGSTRTAEGLKACATTFDSLACAEVAKDPRPSCITPGTLPVGAKCVFASQCSTLNCEYSGNDATCGQCATEANVGEDCSSPTVDCGNGSSCQENKCESYIATPAKLNEPCGNGVASCDVETYCSEGACKKRVAVGGLCAAGLPCDANGICLGNVCEALPTAGQACAIEPGFETHGQCAPGTVCDWDAATMSGKCVTPPKAGDPCYRPDYRPDTWICDEDKGLHCDTSVTPGVCKAFDKLGEACRADTDCDGRQAVCECADPVTCTTRICRKVQFNGQPCTDPNTMCHPGFLCEGGVCKERESLGTFASSCGQ